MDATFGVIQRKHLKAISQQRQVQYRSLQSVKPKVVDPRGIGEKTRHIRVLSAVWPKSEGVTVFSVENDRAVPDLRKDSPRVAGDRGYKSASKVPSRQALSFGFPTDPFSCPQVP
jgi:hypothetical protein